MYQETKSIPVEYEYTDHYLDGNQLKSERKTGHTTVKVTVTVHDDAFNASVDESVGKIEGLTGAIVGFKTANVAVKKANEKAIVGRVTTGFMNMIEQNINMQNAGMEADMHALAGELTQQCKELDHKHDVMTKDFSRIKSRYTSLFDTINKEFKNRILTLVKPCFDFVDQVKKEQNRRAGINLLSMASIGAKESDAARIAIQASKMKQNAAMLINTSRSFINDNRSLHRAMDVFSLDGSRTEIYFAPIIVADECSKNNGKGQTKVYANPTTSAGGQTESLVMQHCATLGNAVMPSDMLSRISTYFNQQLEAMNDGSVEARRLVSQMKTLFEHSTLRTFA